MQRGDAPARHRLPSLRHLRSAQRCRRPHADPRTLAGLCVVSLSVLVGAARTHGLGSRRVLLCVLVGEKGKALEHLKNYSPTGGGFFRMAPGGLPDVRTDGPPSFRSHAFEDYCTAMGIDLTYSVPCAHEQNGLAESFIKQIQLITRPLLMRSGLAASAWNMRYYMLHTSACLAAGLGCLWNRHADSLNSPPNAEKASMSDLIPRASSVTWTRQLDRCGLPINEAQNVPARVAVEMRGTSPRQALQCLLVLLVATCPLLQSLLRSRSVAPIYDPGSDVHRPRLLQTKQLRLRMVSVGLHHAGDHLFWRSHKSFPLISQDG
ncbi:MAG: hypothetical protein BJ554DRAFT_7159, partial [Olpidium bornovanus]